MSAAEDVARLEAELEALEAEQEALRSRLCELESRGGLIDLARGRLEVAQRAEADERLPRAVWTRAPLGYDAVIVRVTQRSIHLRPPGAEIAVVYRRSTGQRCQSPCSTWPKLDVPACLAAWGEYQRQAK